MNSTQDRISKKDKIMAMKNRVIKNYNDLTGNEEDNIKKKIFKQINNLIVSSNK